MADFDSGIRLIFAVKPQMYQIMRENGFLISLLFLIVAVGFPATAQRHEKNSAKAAAAQTSLPVNDAASSASETVTEERIFTVVEKHAEFPEGASAMQKFIQDNLKMPKVAKKANVSGKVFTKLLVEKDGRITDVQIITGLTPACDAEAIRLIQSMPNWKPAAQRGQIVRSYAMLAIPFGTAEK